MASHPDFVDFVADQLREAGTIRSRKMFGEYQVYVNEKPTVLVCDDIAYIKKLPEVADMMANTECGTPYDGAKEHYILDVEHREELLKVVGTLEKALPYPEKKKKKKA